MYKHIILLPIQSVNHMRVKYNDSNEMMGQIYYMNIRTFAFIPFFDIAW